MQFLNIIAEFERRQGEANGVDEYKGVRKASTKEGNAKEKYKLLQPFVIGILPTNYNHVERVLGFKPRGKVVDVGLMDFNAVWTCSFPRNKLSPSSGPLTSPHSITAQKTSI